ncbi:MAG TPA: M14 family zinc carboxypeptidase [Bacteroidales bacterium]|nr:M14 family zinc carboxypeptidase [Bacteroidales bacterium]
MRQILLVFLLLITVQLYSQNTLSDINKAREILNTRGEVFFSFEKPASISINAISQIISVDKTDGKTIYAYANKQEFEAFLSLHTDFSIVDEYYYHEKALTMAETIEDMANWDRYPTYSLYVEMMQKMAEDFPDICKLDTIGYSAGYNMLILSLIISDNVNAAEPEPRFFWTGTMHGDEITGYIMLLRFADYLLNNYGDDTQITNLVNNSVIYINPLSNPDGTFYGFSDGSDVSGSRRYNINDVDLNRNFPRVDLMPTQIEPEIQAMTDYSFENWFTMSANTHGGAEVFNYPWDYCTSDINTHADDNWWQLVGAVYANAAIENSDTDYFQGVVENGVTEGGDWYVISGSRQDYMNFFRNCREVTLEISNTKQLASEDLPTWWNYNREAMLRYTEQVLYGINGIVTDSITHEPLAAKVTVLYHDRDNSFVFSHLPAGNYHRPIKDGTYTLSFSAEGYRTKNIVVTCSDNQSVSLNAELVTLDSLPPAASFTTVTNYTSCSPVIEFINTSEASDDTEYLWYFGDGSTSEEFSPVHSYPAEGSYTVSLVAVNSKGQDSITYGSYVTIQLYPEPETQNASACAASASLLLTASGDGIITWYAYPDDEEPLYEGDVFTTPVIYETTIYFAQDKYTQTEQTGADLEEDDGAFNTDASDHYLIFDCYQPCILHSVKVLSGGEGNRVIKLINGSAVIDSVEVSIDAGEQTVILDFAIPEGQNLKLLCSGPSNLYRGFSGWWSSFDFPYTINEYLSIKQSDDNMEYVPDETRYYSYFYEWQIILNECQSTRVPVYAVVSADAPDADFSYSVSNGQCQFTDESVNAVSWEWDFGDGSGSSLQNPVHTYTTSNNYTVQLTTTNACGTDTYSESLIIELTSLNNYTLRNTVYPNPTKDLIYFSEIQPGSIANVYTVSGTMLFDHRFGNGENSIDLSGVDAGVYTIQIIDMEAVQNIKVIKLN